MKPTQKKLIIRLHTTARLSQAHVLMTFEFLNAFFPLRKNNPS